MSITSNLLTPAIGFLLVLFFGFWLSKLGKPYNGILFNIHKLIALGTVIVTAMQVYKIFKTLEPQTLITVFIVITAICVVALFASGAFMSIGNVNYNIMKTVHNVAPAPAVIAIGIDDLSFYRKSVLNNKDQSLKTRNLGL